MSESHESRQIPFKPEDVPVDDLDEALQGVDDPGALEALQEVDDRKTAQPKYRARARELEELQERAGPGYRVGSYRSATTGEELPNFECASCRYATLDRRLIEAHVQSLHSAPGR